MNAITDLQERRAQYAALLAAAKAARQANPNVTTADIIATGLDGAPDVPVRLYRPAGARDDVLPVIFFVHGGGMIMGSVDGEDARMADLCDARRRAQRSGGPDVPIYAAPARATDLRGLPPRRSPRPVDRRLWDMKATYGLHVPETLINAHRGVCRSGPDVGAPWRRPVR